MPGFYYDKYVQSYSMGTNMMNLFHNRALFTPIQYYIFQKYDGSFVNCIEQCDKSAQSLLKLVVTDFPSYRDVAEYNGKQGRHHIHVQKVFLDNYVSFGGTNSELSPSVCL